MVSPPLTPIDTIRVALPDPVDIGNAPYGTNPSEDLIFAQIYEGLTHVDCLGSVSASIASTWTVDSKGTEWTFRLDSDARYSDGSPVSTLDIAAAYSSSRVTSTVDSVTAISDQEIRVYLQSPHRNEPPKEASYILAAKKTDRWPLGSGQLVLQDVRSDWATGRIVGESDAAGSGSIVKFIEYNGTDPRDILATNIDLLVTSDPSAIEYATRQDRYAVRPLSWDRTYAVLSRSRFEALVDGVDPGMVGDDEVDALARDAVRADAIGARPLEWWNTYEHCGYRLATVHDANAATKTNADDPLRHGLVVYDRSDPVSRDLAARIVALGASSSRSDGGIRSAIPGLDKLVVAAAGVEASELARRLAAGIDYLYVIALPRYPVGDCSGPRLLLERAPWLRRGGQHFYRAAIPLVDTRRHAIIDTSRVGASIDGRGRLRIETERNKIRPKL